MVQISTAAEGFLRYDYNLVVLVNLLRITVKYFSVPIMKNNPAAVAFFFVSFKECSWKNARYDNTLTVHRTLTAFSVFLLRGSFS